MIEKSPATILLGVSLFLLNTFSPAVIAQIRSPGEVVVIEGATIIDGTGSGPQTGWIIVLGNGRIQDVGPAGQVRRPDGARVIDANGKLIIPGLTDAHVHYYGYEAELYLAHGVTMQAHWPPGHTKGCTAWTTTVEEDGKSYSVVFVGGTGINRGVKLLNNKRHPRIVEEDVSRSQGSAGRCVSGPAPLHVWNGGEAEATQGGS